jgi:hypothetical protein
MLSRDVGPSGATHFFAGTESTGDLRFSLQPITGVGVPFMNPRFRGCTMAGGTATAGL